jgi:hypothetical protein
MEKSNYRGYCESCNKFEVEQSKDLKSLVNSCEKSGGKLKAHCGTWKKQEEEFQEDTEEDCFQDCSNH